MTGARVPQTSGHQHLQLKNAPGAVRRSRYFPTILRSHARNVALLFTTTLFRVSSGAVMQRNVSGKRCTNSSWSSMRCCIIPKSNNPIFPIHSRSRVAILLLFDEWNLRGLHPVPYQTRGRGGISSPSSVGYTPGETRAK